MTTLHLGVIEIPYADPTPAAPKKIAKARKGKANKPRIVRIAVGGQTTGDVASILEAKYHVMEIFFELHGQEIADALAESASGAIESLLSGAAPRLNPFGGAEALIQGMFNKFLDSKEIEGLGYPGVPTKAALTGVNHRLKSRKGAPRPSFIDTGAYEGAFKAWVEAR